MRVFSISRINPHSALDTVHAPLISRTHTFPLSEPHVSTPCMRDSGCAVSFIFRRSPRPRDEGARRVRAQLSMRSSRASLHPSVWERRRNGNGAVFGPASDIKTVGRPRRPCHCQRFAISRNVRRENRIPPSPSPFSSRLWIDPLRSRLSRLASKP